jgi:hypothetical protein
MTMDVESSANHAWQQRSLRAVWHAAVKDQLVRLPHVMLAGCTHPPAVGVG